MATGPAGFVSLTSSRARELCCNQIGVIPDTIGSLTKLTELWASHFGRWVVLILLNVDSTHDRNLDANNLETIPTSIGQLKALTQL